MAFEEKNVSLECKMCGAEHSARYSRQIVREELTIKCIKCRGILFSGNTTADYFNVTLVR